MATGGETAHLTRQEARTHREVLEAAGIDAHAPLEVLRRMLCRGQRARNIAVFLLAILICTLVVTTRQNENRRYLYAPATAYAEDSHLESLHWTHFRHGAPIMIFARNLTTFATQAATIDEGPEGTAGLLHRLKSCLLNPADVLNSTVPAETLDENGMPTSLRTAAQFVADEQGKDNAKLLVDPVIIDPAYRVQQDKQRHAGLFVTRKLQWDRLLFIVTNLASLAEPEVRCLTYLQASAAFMTRDGEWYATHGGLAPPTRAHLLSVALPLSNTGLTAQSAATKGARQTSNLTRFSLLLAPPMKAGDNGGGANPSSSASSARNVGGFAWWAAQRVKHTPDTDGVLLVTDPDSRPAAASQHTALDDAILSRWYHEHHSDATKSKLFSPKQQQAASPADTIAPSAPNTVINPIHPALTVQLSTDGSVVGPVTMLSPLTAATDVPMLVTVRPDGFGVYRAVLKGQAQVPQPDRRADAPSAQPPAVSPASRRGFITQRRASSE
jgi:hypothetical protein